MALASKSESSFKAALAAVEEDLTKDEVSPRQPVSHHNMLRVRWNCCCLFSDFMEETRVIFLSTGVTWVTVFHLMFPIIFRSRS